MKVTAPSWDKCVLQSCERKCSEFQNGFLINLESKMWMMEIVLEHSFIRATLQWFYFISSQIP